MQLLDKGDRILKLLNIEELGHVYDKTQIINEILDYMFEKNEETGKKIFDFEKDYEYYYYDFYKLGIDLNEDKISWWKFNALLTGIFNIKNSSINKIIEYRTYETPSKDGKREEREYNENRLKLRRKYTLDDGKIIENSLDNLWNFLSYQERRNKHD